MTGLDICKDNHEPITYSSSVRCPACDIRDDLEDTISDLNQELSDAHESYDEVSEELHQANIKLEQYNSIEDGIKKMLEDRV